MPSSGGMFSYLARWTCDVPTQSIRDWQESPCEAQTTTGTPRHSPPFPKPLTSTGCLTQALLDKWCVKVSGPRNVLSCHRAQPSPTHNRASYSLPVAPWEGHFPSALFQIRKLRSRGYMGTATSCARDRTVELRAWVGISGWTQMTLRIWVLPLPQYLKTPVCLG